MFYCIQRKQYQNEDRDKLKEVTLYLIKEGQRGRNWIYFVTFFGEDMKLCSIDDI